MPSRGISIRPIEATGTAAAPGAVVVLGAAIAGGSTARSEPLTGDSFVIAGDTRRFDSADWYAHER